MKITIDITDDDLKADMADSELPVFDEWAKMVTSTIRQTCFPTIPFTIQFSHLYWTVPCKVEDQKEIILER